MIVNILIVFCIDFFVSSRHVLPKKYPIKMLLLGIWYNLSDEKVEESVNDSLSMMRFCDLDIEDHRLQFIQSPRNNYIQWDKTG